jgi:peroxiredoxin
MLKRCLVFLCLVLVCGVTFAFAKTPRPLADVPIRTPDQKKINLKQYRGKVVVLIIFSTACDDCVKTITLFSKFQKDYSSQGLQTVAAAVNQNAAYLVEPFINRYRPTFPIGYLDEEATMKIADFTRDTHPFVPMILFIDRTGIVQTQYSGNDPVFKQQEKAFKAITESLLKFKATTPPAPK